MDPTIGGYFGPKGRGKTALALYHFRNHKRVLFHDLKGHNLPEHGAEIIDDGGQLLERLLAAGDAAPFRICWRGFSTMGPDEAFAWANECAWALGNLAVVWDEVDILTKGHLKGRAEYIANMNRGRDIALAFTARRPAMVPRTLTANADRLCAFRTNEPRDLAYLVDFIGADGHLAGDLGDFRALDWRDGKGAKVKKSYFS
jgi:hypothetical protein